MNKPALLAAVTAGLVVGAVLGVYAPRWFASGAGAPQAVASTQAPAKPVAQRVQVAAVRQVPFARGISAVGSLRSDESVVLRPEVAGRIQSIDFRKGSPWRGQALVRLDDSVPRAELAQARANLTLAQTHYRRAVELQGKGFVSQKARDESASSLKVQEAAVALAQARLDKMTITAPFSGIAGLRSVSVGDYVSQGQGPGAAGSHRPAQGGFPRAGNVSEQGGRGPAADLAHGRCPARIGRGWSMPSVRWSMPAAVPSCCGPRWPTATRYCVLACSPGSSCNSRRTRRWSCRKPR